VKTPNPLLKKLGLTDDDRAVILHVDDIGMCHASVQAFADLDQLGAVSSGAVMVPCPWFLHAADYARRHPRVDLGVHLTLTSEWKVYRWGPLSTCDPASGLLDEAGYFYPDVASFQQHAVPAAVGLELETQVQRFMQAGITPTHVDTHMFSLAHPKFMRSYIQVALKFGLPPMIFRLDEAGWRALGLDAETAQTAAGLVARLEQDGLPMLDNIAFMPLDNPQDHLERMKQVLSDLKPGLTHFYFHPSIDTPELRAITPDWRCRVADYRDFCSEDLHQHIRNLGLHVIGYRALQELMTEGVDKWTSGQVDK
jgi:predicted glycoside hydrolase/deacetylase ChbG (UPF0249 family)